MLQNERNYSALPWLQRQLHALNFENSTSPIYFKLIGAGVPQDFCAREY